MYTRFLAAVVVSATALTARPALAQSELPFSLPVPLQGTDQYNGDIPTPEGVIGHEIGTRHTEPHQTVAFFRAIDEASDRVAVDSHGRSYEGRPLVHAIVTSPENHARLEEIRRRNLQLSDDPTGISDSDIESMPAIVLAGYSIHGNEASGTEAALLLLYHLAAGESATVEDVLQNTVVIIDPMFNPDGRGRFTTWANRNRGGVPVLDPNDREHDEPWPGGRTNHYWFDLNRDWLPAQHPESQGRLTLFHEWRPQVLTDHHEMGSESTFFFQPGIPSRNNPNTPERTYELTGRLAEFHAAALDEIGSLYFTRESYDDYYYGKGSTYPDVNGAVGILFEQASSRALERETSRGTLTYPFTVRNQFVTSLSTLEGTLDMREDLLRHQRDFYASAPEVAEASEVKAWVVDTGRTPVRSAALAQILHRHRVRIHQLAGEVESGGRTFRPGEAYVVPIDQPQARLVKAAMERVTTFQDSLFYDVSTWTLPLAFGVDYAELRGGSDRYVGAEITAPLRSSGRVVGGRSRYAYVMEWGSYFAPRALYRLQSQDVETRVIQEPFTARTAGGPHEFGRGSIVIPVRQDGLDEESVNRMVLEAATEDHVDVYALGTGMTSAGPDIGTGRSEILSIPRIALLTGDGTSAYNTGEVWHLLSERFRIPVSLLDVDDVGRAALDRYTTIIMAGGSYAGLSVEDLRSWVDGGGHLISLHGAVDWVVENGLIDLEQKSVELDSLYRNHSYASLPRARGAQRIGGTILQVNIDDTHPIGYGHPSTLAVFRRGTTFYEPSSSPGRTVAAYTNEPLLSGYISSPMLDQARGSTSIAADRHGRGRVTVLMDNPNFRAFWYGTNGLFLNAVFFGQAY